MKQLITLQYPLITLNPTKISLIISPTHQKIPKTHLKKPLISSKWGKKRSGSQNKLIFNAITTIVSNLKILPEPFDSIVKDFWVVSGGGNGGKIRFKNGFGGGNGGRRNNGKKLGFWVMLVISISLGIWGFLDRERVSILGSEGILVILSCLVLFVILAYCLLRKDFRNWILGFFCGVVFMGLGFRNNVELIKLVDGFKLNLINLGVLLKKRRYKRWI